MSYAVMPLDDYKAACDKVREKVDLTTVRFEETDFGFIRSAVFTAKESGEYVFTVEVKDENKLDIDNTFYAYPEWKGDTSPGNFTVINDKSLSAYFTKGETVRIFINDYDGLKPSDIITATLSYNGEIVENFVEPPKIKSGELAEKVDEVYEAGRKAEQTEFWEIYQMGGKRTGYRSFCSGTTMSDGLTPKEQFWTDENYNPIYPITADDGYGLFISNTEITDTKVPIVILGANMNYAFGSAKNLKTIRSLDITNVTGYTSTFYVCFALENITFVGSVSVDIAMQYSKKLTHESIMSLINALTDFSTDTSGKTHKVNLGSENLAKLTEEEKKIIEDKGWTYS